jgi:hypothetical protein
MADPLDLLPPANVSAKRIYAYRLKIAELDGRIKVGETGRSVKDRVYEQVKTAGLSDVVEILLDEAAVTRDGRAFGDKDVHAELKKSPAVQHLTEGGGVEWFQCSLEDVRSAYNSVVEGTSFTRVREKSFRPRAEQQAAVDAADEYLSRAATEGLEPRFLWNAKMRFGKTFAAYQLAKRRDARRVLVVTYKPAVLDAWETDLLTHTDFEGWEFFSRTSNVDPSRFSPDTPLVCFSSLQDLRGRAADGAIKERNTWIHNTAWDLVIVDEYHYGAWNHATRELLAGEAAGGDADYADALGEDDEGDRAKDLIERLDNVEGKEFLCLSGTPFRAIASSEFAQEQIFNWTYTDEQAAKEAHALVSRDSWNPYGALPRMHLLVYQLPPSLRDVALRGERDEFELNEFFRASGSGNDAAFEHPDQVQAWLDWMRGQDIDAAVKALDVGTAKPFPYSDTNVLPYMSHSVWFLPNVASVYAMRNLLAQPQNVKAWGQFDVLAVAGPSVGVGAQALLPVRDAIGNGYDTKTITLTCGKLLTGVTVPQWSSILMLNSLEAPESYFQAAFRVQSPWSIWNPEGDDPKSEKVLKPACLVIDFAPTRGLRLFADYGMRLGAGDDPDSDVAQLSRFLPVLGFDGTQMGPVHVEEIIDVAFENTSIDTARMTSRRFINANLARLGDLAADVVDALGRVAAGDIGATAGSDEDDIGINITPELGDVTSGAGGSGDENGAGAELAQSDLEARLIFLTSRINAFMYLSEVVEKNLKDVLTTDEPDLFGTVMGLSPEHMDVLVKAELFSEQAMRLAIHQFRRADEASFSYTGIDPRAKTILSDSND